MKDRVLTRSHHLYDRVLRVFRSNWYAMQKALGYVRPKQSANYDAHARHYDSTRNLPEDALATAFQRLQVLGYLVPKSTVLDAGCGTGQLSLPLANQGVPIVGIDLSFEMLHHYQHKLPIQAPVTLIQGDVQCLPFQKGAFDVTVISKLFIHVGNWRLGADEILRVTQSHIIILTEQGHFGHPVLENAKSLLRDMGYPDLLRSRSADSDLIPHFRRRRCRVTHLNFRDLHWSEPITYGKAIEEIEKGAYAQFDAVSPDHFQQMLRKLHQWIDSQPDRENTIARREPFLNGVVISKMRT